MALVGIFLAILVSYAVIVNSLLPSSINQRIDENLAAQSFTLTRLLEENAAAPATVFANPRFQEYSIGFQSNIDGEVTGEFRSAIFEKTGLSNIDEHALFRGFDQFHQDNSALGHSQGYQNSDEYSHFWRVQVTELSSGRIAIAAPLQTVDLLESNLTNSLLIAGVVMAAVTLVGGVLFGYMSQKRISYIEDNLKLIAQGDLTIQIAPPVIRDDIDQLMQNIDDTTKQLANLMDEVKHLSSNIAHEIRTPLARLHSTLERGADNPELHRQAFETALKEADNIAHIFDTIMRISRANSGVARDTLKDVDLAELAREAAEIYGAVVESHDRELHLSIHEAAVIQGDREALLQVIGNLVQNALAHSKTLTPITIAVDHSTLTIVDLGQGIPLEERDKVLQPMYQLDKTRASDGFGLGLALVKAIADLHNATLELTATIKQPPEGLTVNLHF